MDGVELLVHAIRGEEVCDAGELEEEAVFEAVHWRWADNCRFREDEARVLLAASLVRVSS